MELRQNAWLILKRGKMWPGTESNCRHEDFQSSALPTELPGRTEVCSSLDEWVVLAREPQSLSISNIRRQCAATPESGRGWTIANGQAGFRIRKRFLVCVENNAARGPAYWEFWPDCFLSIRGAAFCGAISATPFYGRSF